MGLDGAVRVGVAWVGWGWGGTVSRGWGEVGGVGKARIVGVGAERGGLAWDGPSG